ncbi:MAG: hypothetical protein RR420_05315 [Anaerovoracaceae bacterium]
MIKAFKITPESVNISDYYKDYFAYINQRKTIRDKIKQWCENVEIEVSSVKSFIPTNKSLGLLAECIPTEMKEEFKKEKDGYRFLKLHSKLSKKWKEILGDEKILHDPSLSFYIPFYNFSTSTFHDKENIYVLIEKKVTLKIQNSWKK